jgi:arabinofuranosyltransferase
MGIISNKSIFYQILVLIACTCGLIGLGFSLYFTQDDAFIIFRYAANLVSGNGLVFNPGEWVEGFTCPLWVLVLSGVQVLGIDTPQLAGIWGLLFAVGTLWVIYAIGIRIRSNDDPWWKPLLSPILLAANPAFASFATSGLETGLFCFLMAATSLGLIIALERGRFPIWLGLGYVLLTLTRPEGMLVFAVAWVSVTAGNFRDKGSILKMLPSLAGYALPILLITVWRWVIYGYPFPNPAYAKIILDRTSIIQGLNYAGQFLTDYGWFGAMLILAALPMVVAGRNRRYWRVLGIIFLAFSIYIILIGGDVLKGLRFFVPLLPIYYLLIQEGIGVVWRRWFRNMSPAWAIALVVGIMVLLLIPQFTNYHKEKSRAELENGLIAKMTILGNWFKSHEPDNTSIAANSIGTLGYMTGYRIMDMVGLVDETIAHHPKPVPGIRSPAKERTYNADHVMAERPDFIVFDTYEKPNHAGDFALYLHPMFRHNYYRYSIWIQGQDRALVVFKNKGAPHDTVPSAESGVAPDFVYALRNGMELVERDPKAAETYFLQAHQLGPPDFAQPLEWLGMLARNRGDRAAAESYFRQAIAIDSFSVYAVDWLAKINYNDGAMDEALALSQWLIHIDPHIPDGWLMTAWILQKQGKKEDALRYWREGLSILGNNPELLNLIESPK